MMSTTCKVIMGIFTFSDQEIWWTMYSYNSGLKKKESLDVRSNSVHRVLF